MFDLAALYQFGSLSSFYFFAAGIAIVVAFLLWRRRTLIGAWYLMWLEVAVAAWSCAAAFEMAATVVPLKIWWTQVSYVGVTSAPVFFFLFAAEFGQQSHWLSTHRVAALFLLPAFFLFAAATNQFHGLIWQEVWMRPDSFWAMYEHGPLFWAMVVYEYTLLVAGIVFLLQAQRLFPDFYRIQNTFLLIGVLLPLGGNLVDVFGFTPLPGVNWTPMSFALSGVILALGILCFRVLDVVPIARKQVIDAMSEGIAAVDNSGRIVDANPAACQFLQSDTAGLIGMRARDVFAPWYATLVVMEPGSGSVEIQLSYGFKKTSWLEIQRSEIRDARGRLWGQLILMRDVSDRKEAESRLIQMAATDELTGLYNRRRFFELARGEFNRAKRYSSPMTIFLLDIDYFKRINDEYGHDAGDTALRCIASMMSSQLRSLDVLARLGGEEFVALLPETHQFDAERIAERIRSEIESTAIDLPETILFATVSIGVAGYSKEMQDVGELITRADEAMYRAKRDGRNQVCLATPRNLVQSKTRLA